MYFFAILIILFSSFWFPVSEKPEDIIITLFIFFLPHCFIIPGQKLPKMVYEFKKESGGSFFAMKPVSSAPI